MPKLSMIAFGAELAAGAALAGEVVVPSGGVWTAYSMVTRDGRRLVSRGTGNAKKWELVPTNSLPANLPSVRQWTIYGIKSAHSDLGLHRSNYVQRKGTVLRMDKAKELIAADGKPHRLVDLKRKRSISVKASGNDTWYVWNPGTGRTPLCETLSPDEWQRFYCLEPVMKKTLPLAPGKSRMHKFKVTVGK